jgi:hypothetical protein
MNRLILYTAFILLNFFFDPSISYSQNMGISAASPVSKLDVNGNVTVGTTYAGTNAAPSNGALIEGNVGIGLTSPNGKLHLYEATGTTVTATAATLILEHGNSGGLSGILFKSAVNPASDHGYIKYLDDGSGNGSTSENSLLEIGTMDNPDDHVSIMASGNVGINTRAPNSTLHVLGGYQGKARAVSTTTTLANNDWFVLVTNNSTTTLTLPTLSSPTTNGKILYIRATGGASTSITISPAAGNSLSVHTSWYNPMVSTESITLISNGTTWYVVTGD